MDRHKSWLKTDGCVESKRVTSVPALKRVNAMDFKSVCVFSHVPVYTT
jgi:hypothetical protein